MERSATLVVHSASWATCSAGAGKLEDQKADTFAEREAGIVEGRKVDTVAVK